MLDNSKTIHTALVSCVDLVCEPVMPILLLLHTLEWKYHWMKQICMCSLSSDLSFAYQYLLLMSLHT